MSDLHEETQKPLKLLTCHIFGQRTVASLAIYALSFAITELTSWSVAAWHPWKRCNGYPGRVLQPTSPGQGWVNFMLYSSPFLDPQLRPGSGED